jgi:glycosyltransferase involved in cell wall biosynthesis
MWRALRILADAAPSYGWELRYAVPARHELIAATGIEPEHVQVVPGLGAWRRATERVRLPLTIGRLVAAARGATAFYSTTLSTFPQCWLAGGILGIPTVAHVYSSYGSARPYRKHWLARARDVVAPSADSLRLAAEAIGGFAPQTRARVVYNGVDVEGIRRQGAAALDVAGVARPGFRIGMVGNLDWRKNPLCLIDACPAIVRAVPNLRVLLIGAFPDAEMDAKVRGRIRDLGLDAVIQVTGFLANPFPLVRQLDVLVHPALRDPFPLALLEGMALGRPIVASAVGGIPEMLVDGKSGVLVPPDDPAALAAAVIALAQDDARRVRIGAEALARLTTVLTLPAFAAAMFDVFDGAVRARHPQLQGESA